jgi:hypothetical protein
MAEKLEWHDEFIGKDPTSWIPEEDTTAVAATEDFIDNNAFTTWQVEFGEAVGVWMDEGVLTDEATKRYILRALGSVYAFGFRAGVEAVTAQTEMEEK